MIAPLCATHRACFDTAVAYLGGFGCGFGLVTGNHDLEGAEFATDEENLAAWHQARRSSEAAASPCSPLQCNAHMDVPITADASTVSFQALYVI